MSFETLSDAELCGQLHMLQRLYDVLDHTSTQAAPTPVRQFYDNYLRSSESCTHLAGLIAVCRSAADERGLSCG